MHEGYGTTECYSKILYYDRAGVNREAKLCQLNYHNPLEEIKR